MNNSHILSNSINYYSSFLNGISAEETGNTLKGLIS